MQENKQQLIAVDCPKCGARARLINFVDNHIEWTCDGYGRVSCTAEEVTNCSKCPAEILLEEMASTIKLALPCKTLGESIEDIHCMLYAAACCMEHLIGEDVASIIRERIEVGMQRYGKKLRWDTVRPDGTKYSWPIETIEEIADALIYLKAWEEECRQTSKLHIRTGKRTA